MMAQTDGDPLVIENQILRSTLESERTARERAEAERDERPKVYNDEIGGPLYVLICDMCGQPHEGPTCNSGIHVGPSGRGVPGSPTSSIKLVERMHRLRQQLDDAHDESQRWADRWAKDECKPLVEALEDRVKELEAKAGAFVMVSRKLVPPKRPVGEWMLRWLAAFDELDAVLATRADTDTDHHEAGTH